MFWQEETTVDQFQVSNDIVDLVFDIDCKELPVDHAYALATAIIEKLPWIKEDPRIGIHTVHVAGSQNGWERPAHDTQNRLILSHRAKLTLRVPKDKFAMVRDGLTGSSIDVAGCTMHIGTAKLRLLSKNTTIFARYVEIADREDESTFLNWVAQELSSFNVSIRKALCGRIVAFTTPHGPLVTRSLLLAELSLEESLRLQQRGLGDYRFLGCGIFLPHKGVGAVKNIDGE